MGPIWPRALLSVLALGAGTPGYAAAHAAPEAWAVQAQATSVTQFHPRFASPYQGDHSLDPGNRGRETTDFTVFAGVRPWTAAELWVNPEIDQGFGLSDTTGVAGFPSGEAYKVGRSRPYVRLPRAFFRQHVDAGGDPQPVAAGANQLGDVQTADGLTLTIGKFAVVDVFDTNRYAHDQRADFLNWAILDAAAFDYAADAWGYTLGGAAEWARAAWTLRGGLFDLSREPNGKTLERGFGQFALIAEVEHRHDLGGRAGKLKGLAFVNRGRMARYDDAVAAGEAAGTTPDVATVRRYASRPGLALNLEQDIDGHLGGFARASFNDGSKETYEFTDVNRSLAAGLALHGERWQRAGDTLGLAAVVNGLSPAARRYFAAGGLGVLIGDGRLPHYGAERIAEAYYATALGAHATLALDLQGVFHPAYNRDRGPAAIIGLRLHAEL